MKKILNPNGPPNDLCFGSVDMKETKRGESIENRKLSKEVNLSKKIASENTSFEFIDPSSLSDLTYNDESDTNITDDTSNKDYDRNSKTNLKLLKLPNVELEADRYNLSDGAVAAIVNAVLIDTNQINMNDQDLVCTTMKIHNLRKKYRCESVKQ